MRIVADESVDGQVVARLRQDGHEVEFIAEIAPGINDETVLLKSREAQAVLLTADKDFGELVFRQALLHSGVVLIRLTGLDAEAKAQAVSNVVREHGKDLAESFAVLSKRALRLRRLMT